MGIVLLIICAVVFYKAAEMEDAPGILWASLSVAVFLLTSAVLHWGLLGCVLGQILLFVGIGVFKMLRDSRRR